MGGRFPPGGFFLSWVCLLAVSLFSGRITAQERETGAGGSPYLIPQTVFVGDQGRLVVPLGPAFAGLNAFVRDSPEKLPVSPDLVIHRIELEHRGAVSRLLIDFAAYRPGRVFLPPIDLPLDTETLQITGLELSIASILSPASMILADPAPPLPVPGTTLLIYGALGVIILIFFLMIGGGLGGRRYLVHFWESLKRRLLLRSMENIIKRLRAEALQGKSGESGEGEILARFSGEMRNFLSLFTGMDCRAWTAGEFFGVSPEVSAIFRRSDTLRFSGTGIGGDELYVLLEDAWGFIKALGEAEKSRKPGHGGGTGELLLQLNGEAGHEL